MTRSLSLAIRWYSIEQENMLKDMDFYHLPENKKTYDTGLDYLKTASKKLSIKQLNF